MLRPVQLSTMRWILWRSARSVSDDAALRIWNSSWLVAAAFQPSPSRDHSDVSTFFSSSCNFIQTRSQAASSSCSGGVGQTWFRNPLTVILLRFITFLLFPYQSSYLGTSRGLNRLERSPVVCGAFFPPPHTFSPRRNKDSVS